MLDRAYRIFVTMQLPTPLFLPLPLLHIPDFHPLAAGARGISPCIDPPVDPSYRLRGTCFAHPPASAHKQTRARFPDGRFHGESSSASALPRSAPVDEAIQGECHVQVR